MKVTTSAALAAGCLLLLAAPRASAGEFTRCEMVFDVKGWSFLYKTMKGTGKVTCENGQRANVKIESHAAGISFGKSEINKGRGTFSEVRSIKEIYGTYVAGEAHAGATKSTAATAMTRGEVSLVLSGQGRGIDVGLTLGGFTISPP